MKSAFAHTLVLLVSVFPVPGFKPCSTRTYPGQDSVVCVCNTTYCDNLDVDPPPPAPQAVGYTSTKTGDRFLRTVYTFTSTPCSGIKIQIDPGIKYQPILGFGGAFTDAACINILSLPAHLQDGILKSYFSSEGAEYSMARVPIGSCDFSTHSYTYDDVEGDFALAFFNLTAEDYNLKIPLIKRARVLRDDLKLFASAWTAPAWMKTNGETTGFGSLKGSPEGIYYETWGEYYIKFLAAYKEEGVDFWGITAGNEPLNGLIPGFRFQCMAFTPETQADFIAHLGPKLEASGYAPGVFNLMIMDDSRLSIALFNWPNIVLSNPTANQYVSGVAVHWYWNTIFSPVWLDGIHTSHPDKFLLSTEACIVPIPSQQAVQLGNWGNAEKYAVDIIENLLHWSGGWVDWNLALNMSGGPNWVNNNVDAPIIVDAEKMEFYKQPMYYAMAHFSKFLKPGSKRIRSSMSGAPLLYTLYQVAFLTPSNRTVLTLVNPGYSNLEVCFHDPARGYLTVAVKKNSISSIFW